MAAARQIEFTSRPPPECTLSRTKRSICVTFARPALGARTTPYHPNQQNYTTIHCSKVHTRLTKCTTSLKHVFDPDFYLSHRPLGRPHHGCGSASYTARGVRWGARTRIKTGRAWRQEVDDASNRSSVNFQAIEMHNKKILGVVRQNQFMHACQSLSEKMGDSAGWRPAARPPGGDLGAISAINPSGGPPGRRL